MSYDRQAMRDHLAWDTAHEPIETMRAHLGLEPSKRGPLTCEFTGNSCDDDAKRWHRDAPCECPECKAWAITRSGGPFSYWSQSFRQQDPFRWPADMWPKWIASPPERVDLAARRPRLVTSEVPDRLDRVLQAVDAGER